MRSLIAVAALLISSTPCAGQGRVINVPADTSTIQAAVNIAQDGDTVLVAEGLYYENILIQSKSIVVGSHFLVDSDSSHISRTIINGSRPANTDLAGVVRIRGCRDTTTVLYGFTITGGFGNRQLDGSTYTRTSAGIGVPGSSALIAHNRIIGNAVTKASVPDAYESVTGGGIGVFTRGVGGTFVVVRDNLIADNTIEGHFSCGAGIAIITDVPGDTVHFIIERNVIRGNTNKELGTWKGMGGGLSLGVDLPSYGTKVVRNNVIDHNRVLGALANTRTFGGGVYIVYTDTPSGTVDPDPGELFYNNIISHNHSDYLGGGVSIWRFSSETTNLTSWGNYVPRPAFINNTIVNNGAQDGSGFFIMDHVPFLMNNILWDEPKDSTQWGEIYLGDVPEWLRWHGPNTYRDVRLYYSAIRGGWEDTLGNIDSDPLLDSTYRLIDSSPCIGAGVDSMHIASVWHHAPSVSFYGGPRPQPSGTRPDIGACESALATDVPFLYGAHPIRFVLKQNYPNPFNPSTTIKYELPEAADVKLKVFDLLGREVSVLVNEIRSRGVHEVKFNGNNLASGVYLYRMQAGNYVETRKLLLVR